MNKVNINADIFDVGAQVIVHQVNCMGVMGAGIAKQIKDKFPSVFLEYHKAVKTLNHNCLGGCLVSESRIPGLRIANLFGQFYYKGFKEDDLYFTDESWKQPEFNSAGEAIRFTNYEAFWRGLTHLKYELREEEIKIAFPFQIGCGLGGADWNVIEAMIDSVFEKTNKEIMICRL